MIKKLKRKFIALAMIVMFFLLLIIVAGMNILNYNSVVVEADTILEILSKNKGDFPEPGGMPNNMAMGMSPEIPYESRYFSVFLNEAGDIIDTRIDRIASVDRSMAINYARVAIKEGSGSGFIGNYRYIINKEFNGTRITFLDCGRKLDTFFNFLYTSIGMMFIGLIIVYVIIVVASGKIIKPIAASYEKQKQFITDAGHELKTPLTIINANVDMLEMEIGEDNESLEDIRSQTDRLRNLTNDLVMLARMEETENKVQKIDFPVSEIVYEATQSFNHLATQQNKKFICDIEPLLTLYGNGQAIGQLVGIILDNSLKYTEEGVSIFISLKRHGKDIVFSVANKTKEKINEEQLKYVFERFYRMDTSRNSETGGHGIGLSVAKAITLAHNGKINASINEEDMFVITVVLPT